MPSNNKQHIIIGMAGHIDHGKTAIVKALTGTNTDRLKEEIERGMTTDLGFAFLGDEVTIIDVPGHEKFVKTMVAGVNTVDMAILVIAADDGIMPQTREHLEILNLLKIKAGLVVINKIDLVENDWLTLVQEDIKQLLPRTVLENAPVIPVSAVTGEGIVKLKKTILDITNKVEERKDKGIFRLPIDRVFSIKGFGTVVAGTILSGKVKLEDSVELLPSGRALRVRGIQVHDKPVNCSSIGFRTAINVSGIEKESIERGDVLAEPGFFLPTFMLDAHLLYLKSAGSEFTNRTRIHFHIGTSEVTGRIILLDKEALQPGEEGFIQAHLEKPVVADAGDRFVIRNYSPVYTIGGGSILNVHPEKHKRFKTNVIDQLNTILKGDPAKLVLEYIKRNKLAPTSSIELAKSLSLPEDISSELLMDLKRENEVIKLADEFWFAKSNIEYIKNLIISSLELFHQKNLLRLGITFAELHTRIKPQIDRKLLESICCMLTEEKIIKVSGEKISLYDFEVKLTADQIKTKDKILKLFHEETFASPNLKPMESEAGKDSAKIISLMLETNELISLEENLVLHKDAINAAKKRIAEYFKNKEGATVSELKQHLGLTRKFAVPILEYLDSIGFTERNGDIRYLKRN